MPAAAFFAAVQVAAPLQPNPLPPSLPPSTQAHFSREFDPQVASIENARLRAKVGPLPAAARAATITRACAGLLCAPPCLAHADRWSSCSRWWRRFACDPRPPPKAARSNAWPSCPGPPVFAPSPVAGGGAATDGDQIRAAGVQDDAAALHKGAWAAAAAARLPCSSPCCRRERRRRHQRRRRQQQHGSTARPAPASTCQPGMHLPARTFIRSHPYLAAAFDAGRKQERDSGAGGRAAVPQGGQHLVSAQRAQRSPLDQSVGQRGCAEGRSGGWAAQARRSTSGESRARGVCQGGHCWTGSGSRQRRARGGEQGRAGWPLWCPLLVLPRPLRPCCCSLASSKGSNVPPSTFGRWLPDSIERMLYLNVMTLMLVRAVRAAAAGVQPQPSGGTGRSITHTHTHGCLCLSDRPPTQALPASPPLHAGRSGRDL